MSGQVFQTEVVRKYLPSSSGLGVIEPWNSSRKDFKVIEGVEVYPESLRSAVEHVDRFFPQMFSILPSILGSAIRIHLQVNVPIVQKHWVHASDLREKKIVTRDLIPDQKGLIRIDDLLEQGVVISSESIVATWYYESRVLVLGSENFSRCRQEFWRELQVSSLLFELQNAQFTPEFQKVCALGATLSKETFVQGLEEIEFSTKALTCGRLRRLSLEQEFNEGFNFCRFLYDDFELFYLHQQAVNHSTFYAKYHDDTFRTEVKRPYQGTWEVAFPPPAKDGTLSVEQEELLKVLSLHLEAINDTGELRERKEREMYERIAKIQKCASWGVRGYQNIWRNLQFFQTKYATYVRCASPDRVVHLITDS